MYLNLLDRSRAKWGACKVVGNTTFQKVTKFKNLIIYGSIYKKLNIILLLDIYVYLIHIIKYNNDPQDRAPASLIVLL